MIDLFSNTVRIILFIVSLISGLLMLPVNSLIGVILLMNSLLVLYGYFKYGNVWIGFHAITKGRYSKGRKLLSRVKRPEILHKSQIGYYYFGQGLICIQDKEYDTALGNFLKAFEIGLHKRENMAYVSYYIMLLQLLNGEHQESEKYLKYCRAYVEDTGLLESSTFGSHYKVIKDEIERLKEKAQ